MHKTLLLCLVLSAACSPAMQYPSGEENKAPAGAPGLTTLEGCLQYANGVYSLIENGTEHRLAGKTKELKAHVGHEIEVTGKPSSRTLGDTPPGGASSGIQQYVFEVKSVKHVANLCK
jgi:hypothetical protein